MAAERETARASQRGLSADRLHRACDICGNDQVRATRLWQVHGGAPVRRCMRCDFIWADSSQDPTALLSGSAYEFPALHEMDVAGFREEAFSILQWSRKHAGSLAGLRGLDVGCGFGHACAAGAALGMQMRGLDVSGYAIARARQLYPHIEFRQGVIEDEGEEAAWDLLYCHQVIEHVWRPGRFLEACRKALKPGGILILGTPQAECLYKRLTNLAWRISRGRVDVCTVSPTGHTCLFSRRSMREALTRRGFEPIAFAGRMTRLGERWKKDTWGQMDTSFSRTRLGRLIAALAVLPYYTLASALKMHNRMLVVARAV